MFWSYSDIFTFWKSLNPITYNISGYMINMASHYLVSFCIVFLFYVCLCLFRELSIFHCLNKNIFYFKVGKCHINRSSKLKQVKLNLLVQKLTTTLILIFEDLLKWPFPSLELIIKVLLEYLIYFIFIVFYWLPLYFKWYNSDEW